MDNIKSILYSIALIGVISGIFNLLSGSTKYDKYVKYVSSLLVVLLLLSPLLEVAQLFKSDGFDSYSPYEISERDQKNNVEAVIKKAIKEDVSKKYALPQDAFSVSLNIADSVVENLEITIHDSSYFRYAERIKIYIKNNYGCEIKIKQEFETS